MTIEQVLPLLQQYFPEIKLADQQEGAFDYEALADFHMVLDLMPLRLLLVWWDDYPAVADVPPEGPLLGGATLELNLCSADLLQTHLNLIGSIQPGEDPAAFVKRMLHGFLAKLDQQMTNLTVLAMYTKPGRDPSDDLPVERPRELLPTVADEDVVALAKVLYPAMQAVISACSRVFKTVDKKNLTVAQRQALLARVLARTVLKQPEGSAFVSELLGIEGEDSEDRLAALAYARLSPYSPYCPACAE